MTMKLKFKINYHTRWGQNVFVCGSCKELGNDIPANALPLFYAEDGNWEAHVKIDTKAVKNIRYRYLIINEADKSVLWEWGSPRTVKLSTKISGYVFEDSWRSHSEPENAFLSQAFTDNLFNRKKPTKKKAQDRSDIGLQLIAPRIQQNQSFCIVGSSKSLGSWIPDKPLIMSDKDYPVWKAEVKLQKGEEDIEYKYGIYDHTKKKLIEWEEGENRYVSRDKEHPYLLKTDLKFRHAHNHWKGAGVAIPVFSLRSENSYGVGEFLDIKLLIDWAVKTGLKIVQILPINDTVATHTWTDSYPYAAISVFALHPIYLNLPAMGSLESKKEMKRFQENGKKLNELSQIDYEAVMKLKSPYYKKLFDQNREQFLNDEDFQKFFTAKR